MEIKYYLPLELNCLMFGQQQEGDKLLKATIRYKAFINWDSILAVEEFVKNDLFPEDEKCDKTVIITTTGQYIVPDSIHEISQAWGLYKSWKSKQVHKSIFSAN